MTRRPSVSGQRCSNNQGHFFLDLEPGYSAPRLDGPDPVLVASAFHPSHPLGDPTR